MKQWRLITDDNVSAEFGLGADEMLADRAGSRKSPPTLRLYTYRSHCALVGRFQCVEHEIDLQFCRREGISINRRPTGGGAIIMGTDQLGVALTLPGRGDDTYGLAREIMAGFSRGLSRALEDLGVQADFRRKNDLEIDGRKIAGLGIHRHASGGLLFHASLLIDLNVPLMLRVLKTHFQKISDKEISTVAARTSTVRREIGRDVPVDEVRSRVARGYAEAFSIELSHGDFTPEERHAIAKLEETKYRLDDWVFQSTDVPDVVGAARVKTPGGLLDVRVALAGRMLKAVYVRGDFFASESAVADLEASLRWHSSESHAVAATCEAVYARRRSELAPIPLNALTEGIQAAVQQAAAPEADEPYGCFVKPEGAYA